MEDWELVDPAGADSCPGLDDSPLSPPQDFDPVLNAFHRLMDQLRDRGEEIARRLALPTPVLMALTQLTGPMPMKELGRKLGCERSFVTAIADELEQRALVQREPDLRDRRVKNLVLTREGLAMRSRLDREFFARLPWQSALDDAERATLLSLLTKLTQDESQAQAGPQSPADPAVPGGRD